MGYRDACILQQTCGKVRLIRALGVLLLCARRLVKDFDQATRDDLQRLVSNMLTKQPPYSPETLGTYKAIIKRFYTWLAAPTEFNARAVAPPIVNWITTHVRARDKKKLQRNQLLFPSDIEQVMNVTQNARDKALPAVLWETGGRIAEIGNLQLKHLTKTDVGYTLEVTGKTGTRTVLIVSSAPLLTLWLNVHPFRADPEAPLWVHYQFSKEPLQLKYDTIRNMLVKQFARAGIPKRVYPHLFRHSRATYVLATGLMTEA
ncbi:MAG TPA: tyrosine-type recombinase/integrase [Thermoanaerobaculia bacterium]|jgi:integrase